MACWKLTISFKACPLLVENNSRTSPRAGVVHCARKFEGTPFATRCKFVEGLSTELEGELARTRTTSDSPINTATMRVLVMNRLHC